MSVLTRPILPFCTAILLAGCTYYPDVTFDMTTIDNPHQFEIDKRKCEALADRIDLQNEVVATSMLAGFAGGLTVAGIAAAIYGTVYQEAIPFIAGATFLGTNVGADYVKRKEQRQKTKLLSQCMRERGYRVYSYG
jgi:hypothetical protein